MKHIFQILPCLLAMFSLFGCFKKKEVLPKNVEEWVALHFPDQLTVLDGNRNYSLKDYFFTGTKIAVLADKLDPEVQFTMKWSKPSKGYPSLGLEKEYTQAKLDTCRADVKKSRELFTLLKNNGLERFSTCSMKQSAYILVFQEPTPAARLKIIEAVTKTLRERTEQPQTSIWIEIMEPTVYHEEFQDVIPEAHWQNPSNWDADNKIMSLDFEWNKIIPVEALAKGWELSRQSGRLNTCMAESYPQAQAWAEKNLSKPFYLEAEQMVRYDLEKMPRTYGEEDPLSIRFTFPYYKKEPPVIGDKDYTEDGPEPKGYVTGIYNFDTKKFADIKKIKDL